MNSSETHNRDELRRKAMKRRLNKWDSFFSQVEEKFGCSSATEDTCLDKNSLNDPQFLNVEEEHSKLREALRIDYGINEDSEISDVELQHELCNNQNLNAIDTDTSANESNNEKISPRKCSDLDHKSGNHKKKECASQNINLTAKVQKNIIQGPKNQKPGCNFKGVKKPETPYKGTMSKAKSKESAVKKRPMKGKNNVTQRLSELMIRQGKVIEETEGLPERSESHLKTTSIGKQHEKSFSSTHWETRSELVKTRKLSDTSSYQFISRESLIDMCKQYNLWKLHQKRKAGYRGSVYLVSSLDEEPSDANRFVPELPPVTKNPFSFRKRFALKKAWVGRYSLS